MLSMVQWVGGLGFYHRRGLNLRFDFIQSLKYATALSEKLSVLGILPGIIKGIQSNQVNLPWTQLQYRYGRLAKTTRP